MNRFRLCIFVIALILFSLANTSQATARPFPSAPSATTSRRQAFRTAFNNVRFHGRAEELESQKRKVPTGSNPLHNKRRL
ncbi:hypothetical protein JCGZ_13728 [Jatropha curcas]|uniref:Uncharacterized protein n=1 Tax=Jatropha curcas TaxID=180498 RepID=A0A067KEW5_JATCU|nr:hypothetical protein JCGZ_13728 [Jatropha curcas]